MTSEPENILILQQGDNFYTVVVNEPGRPTGYSAGLTRGEALEVVAARLMGGKAPGFYRTIGGVVAEAKARSERGLCNGD